MPTLFETERLIIRHWAPETDATDAFAIYGDPIVTQFIGGVVEPDVPTVRRKLEMINTRYAARGDGTGSWAVVEKRAGTTIGACLLKHLPDNAGMATADIEVGWHLARSHWGRGYATEWAKAAIAHGLSVLNESIIYAVVRPENLASLRVAERAGMERLGRCNRYYNVELELFASRK